MRTTLKNRLERLGRERWLRRALRITLRSVWLALSIICIGVGVHLIFGWELNPLLWMGIAATSFVPGLLLLALQRPMSAHQVAQRLDRRFNLHQQLTTALELSRQGDANAEGVGLHLLDRAGRTTTQVNTYVRRHTRRPWGEVLAVMATAIVCVGLLILLGIQTFTPSLAAEPLPPLTAPADPQAQPPPEQAPNGQQPGTGDPQPGAGDAQQPAGNEPADPAQNLDPAIAEALADALRDQSATRSAAEALDNGDPAASARELRELADQADQLSPQTRDQLAQELRDAASEIQPRDPQLAEQVEQSADQLQQGDEGAAAGLENLASAIEQAAQSGNQQQAQEGEQPDDPQQNNGGGGGDVGNAPTPGEQRAQEHERLGIDGVPLELESNEDDTGGTPGDNEDPDTAATAGGAGFEASSDETAPSETVQVADDPLRIPADLRDVVQEYFSP